jgi:transposase
MFNDESGFLLAPLVRTTLAPRGHTPVLEHGTARRDKVSVAASLWKTWRRVQVRLQYQTYPKENLTAEDYGEYVRALLSERLPGQPVTLLHDELSIHSGPPLEELLEDFPLLQVECLPPYAPELNPVEALWNYVKLDPLANFAPYDVWHLDGMVNQTLFPLHQDQERLESFLTASPLQW